MNNFRPTNNYYNEADAKLLAKANFVLASMTGNASFPTPSPTIADFTTSITNYAESLDKAASGNRLDIFDKNVKKLEVAGKLHLMANYVMFTAAGDETIARSSGINFTKPKAPRPPIGNPENPVLRNGDNRGELEMRCDSVEGAMAYQFEYTLAPLTPASQWTSVPVTTCKVVFTGLQSGQEYSCRVAAIGPYKQVKYSDVLSRIVL